MAIFEPKSAAVLLVASQNDYFSPDGIPRAVIEESRLVTRMLQDAVSLLLPLLQRIAESASLLLDSPILFTEDYAELYEPVGILKHIAEVGAFRRGSPGAETSAELREFGKRLVHLPPLYAQMIESGEFPEGQG